MATRKIITVFGATGAQGGGLARAILNENGRGEFVVRAVTRNPDSPKAKELASRGAQVVAADLDDPLSVARAMDGAWGAYCVTFYWAHMSPQRELAQAKTMALAAKNARVEHVIWSSLDDSRKFIPLSDERMPTLMGDFKVPHFDAKGEADPLFTENVPTTVLLTSFYWDNLIHFGMGPRRGPDGKLALMLPLADQPLAGIASMDIGACAYGIFKQSRDWLGKTVGIAGEILTGAQMAEVLSNTLNEPVSYRPLSFDAYRKLGFPGADDLANMFQFYAELSEHFRRTRDVETARRLNPSLQNFRTWAIDNRDRIPRG